MANKDCTFARDVTGELDGSQESKIILFKNFLTLLMTKSIVGNLLAKGEVIPKEQDVANDDSIVDLMVLIDFNQLNIKGKNIMTKQNCEKLTCCVLSYVVLSKKINVTKYRRKSHKFSSQSFFTLRKKC